VDGNIVTERNDMTSTLLTPIPTTDTSFAPSEEAAAHFDGLLHFETDCWDVHESLKADDPGFVLLDVRSPAMYAAGHVDRAINVPHGKINERNLAAYPPGTRFVVYCGGTHCNGADKGALRLARLGRPVKKMVGGIEGWKDEGFSLVAEPPSHA
jgi:rhodanese-related sulfurtransferase